MNGFFYSIFYKNQVDRNLAMGLHVISLETILIMKNQLKNLSILIFSLFGFIFLLFLVNQVSQIYQWTYQLNPALGRGSLIAMLAILLILLAAPFYIYFRLPAPLVPAKSAADHPKYLRKLIQRLSGNRRVANSFDLNDPDQLNQAIKRLDAEADLIINRTAKAVFLTTSASQNGKLDALTVLITQSKMVWDIAHLYYQRPMLREMFYLYSNVGATTFFASEIEELDLSDQLEPVITSLMRNPGRAIPVIGPVANIVIDSLVEGSANAFLTLRVGVIAKKYCGAMEVYERKKMRKSAVAEASVMLKSIVLESSGHVINTIVKATKKAGLDTFKSSVDMMNKAADNINERWQYWRTRWKKAKSE